MIKKRAIGNVKSTSILSTKKFASDFLVVRKRRSMPNSILGMTKFNEYGGIDRNVAQRFSNKRK